MQNLAKYFRMILPTWEIGIGFKLVCNGNYLNFILNLWVLLVFMTVVKIPTSP